MNEMPLVFACPPSCFSVIIGETNELLSANEAGFLLELLIAPCQGNALALFSEALGNCTCTSVVFVRIFVYECLRSILDTLQTSAPKNRELREEIKKCMSIDSNIIAI